MFKDRTDFYEGFKEPIPRELPEMMPPKKKGQGWHSLVLFHSII